MTRYLCASALAFAILASPQWALSDENPTPELESEKKIDGFTASMQPWRDPDDPLKMNLDPGWDIYFQRRD